MHLLDSLLPTPRLVELDTLDLGAPAEEVWARVRHGDLATSPLVRALFWIRTVPSRLAGRSADGLLLRIDDLRSSPSHPGFQLLCEQPTTAFAVGAIGKVWQADIPFVHVDDAAAFAAFDAADHVKVAWSISILPIGEAAARLELEVRVDATDEQAWEKFRRYFRLIGPGSRFIRRVLLAELKRELGSFEDASEERTLPGDELLFDARGSLTHTIAIHAKPEAIWPWLVQMGARRAGYYSIDALDHGGRRSARELHPEWQTLHVGEVIPAGDDTDDGFEVLRLEPHRCLVLGGLFDVDAGRQRSFFEERPAHYWHVTWTFLLEPLGEAETQLTVRARAAFPDGRRLHATAIRFVHSLMESTQLRRLAARVEGRLPRDDLRDVLEGVGGAARIAFAWLTPFWSARRLRWGLSEELVTRTYPGDERVASPIAGFTHAVEIDAPREEVWPWIAQVGADRAGFYSYQWLENLAGCEIRNAETVHPEWEVKIGDRLSLAPNAPGLPIVEVDRGRYFLAHAAADESARESGAPWVEASWLFLLEDLDGGRTRFVSRHRLACSLDRRTRWFFASGVGEAVSFAMDRRMLLGVKERVEASRR